jgi:hypothetical protein
MTDIHFRTRYGRHHIQLVAPLGWSGCWGSKGINQALRCDCASTVSRALSAFTVSRFASTAIIPSEMPLQLFQDIGPARSSPFLLLQNYTLASFLYLIDLERGSWIMVHSVFIIIMHVLFYAYCMSTSRYTLLPLHSSTPLEDDATIVDDISWCNPRLLIIKTLLATARRASSLITDSRRNFEWSCRSSCMWRT